MGAVPGPGGTMTFGPVGSRAAPRYCRGLADPEPCMRRHRLVLLAAALACALGATAARALLGRPVAVTRERGQWLRREDGIPVLVTLHPSALLRMQGDDRAAAHAAWLDDLRLLLPRT